MKKLEISAYSSEEAKLQAYKDGITVIYDATVAWKRAGSPILTKNLSIFVANLMENKSMFDFEGAGIIITLSPGIPDTRKKPYKLKNILRKGRCQLSKAIEIRSKDTNEIVGKAFNKGEALLLAKQLVKTFKKDLYGKTVYTSEDLDFEIKYIPSTTASLGSYVVFGVEDVDVRLSKRKSRGLE